MRLAYHPQAAEELIEASGFYEGQVMGLGPRFLDAIEDSLVRLGEYLEPCKATATSPTFAQHPTTSLAFHIVFAI